MYRNSRPLGPFFIFMIRYIAVHHSGGLRNLPYASTQNLSLGEINNAHQSLWPDFISSLGYYVGYNFVILKDGQLIQTRSIGEETAANKNHNFDTISVCLVGNFTPGVDIPTFQQTYVLKNLLLNIIEKRLENYKIQSGAVIDVPIENIVPHRYLSPTTCYGSSLNDNWARNLIIEVFQEKISLLQKIVRAYQSLLMLIKSQNLGSLVPKSCFEENNRD